VSIVQFLTPLVIGAGIFGPLGGKALVWNKAGVDRQIWIQNAAFFWVIPVVVTTLLSAVYLRSIPVTASFRDQAVIFRRKHTWVMTSLYFMTFGTFSGLAASFALLLREVFGGLPGAPDPLRYAFLGALIGSTTRPLGGWISDKVGGARVTLASGAVMIVAAIGATFFTSGRSMDDFGPFFAMMMLLFLASGVGNGSTFRMIPVIFPRKEAAPVLGWTAAIAAYGFFIVPLLFGWSVGRFGSPNVAFGLFAASYAVNLVLCWWFYAREGAEVAC
jgi:NNP family nitrate/nitrite transporter-like MFS transporter